MCLFGRAAFYPLFKHRIEHVGAGAKKKPALAAESLIEVLKAKILGGSLLGKHVDVKEGPKVRPCSGKEYSKARALSILGSMASIEISAGTQLASELTSEHMRMVAAVSRDRRCLYTLEVSEPVLGLAAHHLILEGTVSGVVILGKFMKAAIRSTSIGFRG